MFSLDSEFPFLFVGQYDHMLYDQPFGLRVTILLINVSLGCPRYLFQTQQVSFYMSIAS
jgi:hypothetical protein